jgi:hypothetical protein
MKKQSDLFREHPLDDQVNGWDVHVVYVQLILCGKTVIWQDYICILFCGLDELLETWFHIVLVLLKQVAQEGLVVWMLPRHLEHSARKSHIVIRVNEDLKVHHLHKFFIAEDQVPLNDNDGARLDVLSDSSTDHALIIIDRLVKWLPVSQGLHTLVE